MNKIGVCLICMLLLMLLMMNPVFARGGASDYSALGVIAGGFTIYPEATLGVEFNDNIYAAEDEKESDLIIALAPRVKVRSNWSRHSLVFDAGLKGGFYTSESDENYLDAHLAVDGRVDINRDSFVLGRTGIQRLHEERGSPDAPVMRDAWDEPAVYYRAEVDLSHYMSRGVFSLNYGGGLRHLDYQKVSLVDGGSASLDWRDRMTYNVNAQLAYEMHPEVQPFITTRYEWRRYAESDVDRDSEGIRVGIGSALYLGGVTEISVFGGFMQQDYEHRSKISGFWTGLDLLWEPTRLTTVTYDAQSSIKETTLEESSGIRGVDTNLEVSHDLRRNIAIGAVAGYTLDSFKDIDRSHEYISVGPRATYLLNRNLRAGIGFTHRTKQGSGRDVPEEDDYAQNRFNVSITGQF